MHRSMVCDDTLWATQVSIALRRTVDFPCGGKTVS